MAILILVSILYFITSNNEKENKVEKQVTSPQKKFEVVEVKQTDKEIEEELKPFIREQKEFVRGKVIYKNDETNEGYNMELTIPEKWAHLDYSRLGNPKETELPKEEWAAGDELYKKGHPDYYKDGKTYFSAKAEKILLDIFQDRDRLKLFIPEDPELRLALLGENDYTDINQLIYVDEETGRKMMGEYNFNFFSSAYAGGFDPYDWKGLSEYYQDGFSSLEDSEVYYHGRHQLMWIDIKRELNSKNYFHNNYQKEKQKFIEDKSEFCKNNSVDIQCGIEYIDTDVNSYYSK